MNQLSFVGVVFPITLAVTLAGCSHKTDALSELQKTSDALAKAEAAQPPPPPAAAPEAQAASSSDSSVAPAIAAAPTASQQMKQAITSYKSGQLEDAVTRLQELRRSTSVTAEQRMAIQDSVAAVMSEIYGLAEKGNAAAIQAVKQAEAMQTSRH